jgi:formate hydrogenlyase subunit 3/multisubunit Na+/H+ antiporter MnhD subunit
MLLACLWSRRWLRRLPSLLWLAPVPALAASLFGTGAPPLLLGRVPFLVTVALDVPGAMLLGVAGLLWIAAGVCASGFLLTYPHPGRFSVCWLLTLIGNIGVFMTADLASFYLAFALVSIPAYGLVVRDEIAQAQRAGAIYIALTLLGENLLLIGFVLLAAGVPGGSLVIRDCVAALPESPWRDPALALLIAGFGLKAGLIPLHVWMPLTYRAAPIPAAAVLSGAAVKAGVIGLIRFLPLGQELPEWGGILAIVGLLSAFYGVAVGITQTNPKTVLAYSSVSQMGLIAAVLGVGLVNGDRDAAVVAAFYAERHTLVKGALFLVVGLVAATGSCRLWSALLPAALLALSLGGLPVTGGALAKLAVKASLGESVVATLATVAAAGTTLLMLHFLRRLQTAAADQELERGSPRGLVSPWLAMALASVAVPVALYPAAGFGSPVHALAPAALVAALSPVLLGGILAVGLWRWIPRLPSLPEGDIVVVGEAAARASVAWGAALERAETVLKRWPVACLSLLVAAIILGALMFAGR